MEDKTITVKNFADVADFKEQVKEIIRLADELKKKLCQVLPESDIKIKVDA